MTARTQRRVVRWNTKLEPLSTRVILPRSNGPRMRSRVGTRAVNSSPRFDGNGDIKAGMEGRWAKVPKGDSTPRSYPQDRLGRWVVFQGCRGGNRSVFLHYLRRANRVPPLPHRLGPPKAPARGRPCDGGCGAARPRVSDPGGGLSGRRGERCSPDQDRLPRGTEGPRPREPGRRLAD